MSLLCQISFGNLFTTTDNSASFAKNAKLHEVGSENHGNFTAASRHGSAHETAGITHRGGNTAPHRNHCTGNPGEK